jgi:hypothetical protein
VWLVIAETEMARRLGGRGERGRNGERDAERRGQDGSHDVISPYVFAPFSAAAALERG